LCGIITLVNYRTSGENKLTSLPLKVRNTLRGANDPYALISTLRSHLSADKYELLASWLAVYGSRSAGFHNSRRPRNLRAVRADERIPIIVSPADEFRWATAYLTQYKEHIQAFIDTSARFNNVLLTSNMKDAMTHLDGIDHQLGLSLWSIEKRFFLLQSHDGLEAQKVFLADIRRATRSSVVQFLAFFTSQRNEHTTNQEKFRTQIVDLLRTATSSQEFRTYAMFRLLDQCDSDQDALATILRWEQSSPIIDYYETLVRLVTRATDDGSEALAIAAESVRRLRVLFTDDRLTNIAFLTGDLAVPRNRASPPVIRVLDLWYEGQWKEAITAAEVPEAASDVDCLVASVFARAESGKGESCEPANTLRLSLSKLLFCIAEKESNYEDAYAEILRVTRNLYDAPFAPRIERCAASFMSPDIYFTDIVSRNAALQGPGLRASLLHFVPPSNRQLVTEFLRWAYTKSIALEAEIARANLQAVADVTELTPITRLEVEFDAAWLRSDFSFIAESLSSPIADASTRHKHTIFRYVANALISRGTQEQAVDYVVERYLSDPRVLNMLPVKRCIHALTEHATAHLAAHISLPILFELYSRHVEDKPTELRYAHEDFLAAHGISRPSLIMPLAMQFERQHLIYYLRHVCVPRVMQLSIAFQTSREVEDERVAVCTLLKQLDNAHAGLYDAEIREITRRQSISHGLRQVEQSKIWIDQEPLKQWAEKHLAEDFVRFKALRTVASIQDLASVSGKSSSAPANSTTEIPEVPIDESAALIKRIVSQFVLQCFFDRQHGLDSYLSLRIRHGALSGQMRAPLEAERIITLQKEPGSGEYAKNRYWIDRFDHIDQSITFAVDARLRDFSKDYDNLIEQFTKQSIQIQSENRKEGLFQAAFSSAKVVLMQSDIHSNTTFDSFIDLCFSVFWDSVDESLQRVRDFIDENLLRSLNDIFIELLRDIEWITIGVATPELDNAIRNAQTHALHALEQVKDWFRQSKAMSPTFSTLHGLVDISLQAVKNMYREFNPEVAYAIAEDLPLFFQLQKFTDIFIIVFDNVWRHCGMRQPHIEVSAGADDSFLHIEIRNEVADGVVHVKSESRIQDIQNKIAEGMYHPAVSSEGGTGLMKIRNIVGGVSTEGTKLTFGFVDDVDDMRFFVRLQLPTTVFQMDVNTGGTRL
jgi:hypothetical protein